MVRIWIAWGLEGYGYGYGNGYGLMDVVMDGIDDG
jgi:hypothetical protein